jgi:DNA repair exonuclease SbcCD ATPase subunit
MTSFRQLKLAQKAAAEQQEIISELNDLVHDIDRCEKTITTLKSELEEANAKYPGKRTTREDVAYLTELLECAKKKLSWEKQMASLQKRTPHILERMSRLFNDTDNPPPEQTRAEMVRALESVKACMERLQVARVD